MSVSCSVRDDDVATSSLKWMITRLLLISTDWKRDHISNDEVLRHTGLLTPLAASSIVRKRKLGSFFIRARYQTRWWCSSKPDPSELLQGSSWCAAISRLETCSKLTSYIPPGFNRSAGTREYRWRTLWNWRRTNRFGYKSQRRNRHGDEACGSRVCKHKRLWSTTPRSFDPRRRCKLPLRSEWLSERTAVLQSLAVSCSYRY